MAAAALWGPASSLASGRTLIPPAPTTFFGVSDRGSVSEFHEFADFVDKHPAVMQTFHPWGNSLNQAIPRWRDALVRPMLHISTADDETLEEILTPKTIARGRNDNYLLQLNRILNRKSIPTYIRPIGEPNRCLNVWTAVDCSGNVRGGPWAHKWYRRAFRRIAVIVRGGGTLDQINARLSNAGVPRLNRRGAREPRELPGAPVSMVWSPLPKGSPAVRANLPTRYYPGDQWVDWVGTDFYSRYPYWRDLNRFYSGRRWRDKPFAITEFAVSDSDSPSFIRKMFHWAYKRKRVRMLVYYRGFGESGNPYRLGLYPEATAALRRRLDQRRFPAFAPYHAHSDRNLRSAPAGEVARTGPLG